MTDFGAFIEGVARELLGDPHGALSSPAELRFGGKGSLAVDLKKRTWYDHESKAGGGTLDLIGRETGRVGQERVAWLAERGYPVDPPGAKSNGARTAEHPRADEAPPWEPGEGDAAPSPSPGNYLPPGVPAGASVAATYDYLGDDGALLYQVVRFEWPDPDGGKPQKTFRQRRPVEQGRWIWSVKGVRQVPYRLADVVEAAATGVSIFVVEGEKKADALAGLGAPATCNAMGAGKWSETLTPYFEGAHVVILGDNDEAGRKHRNRVAEALLPGAASVRFLDLPDLPPKGDVIDWLAAGGDLDKLYALVESESKAWLPGLGYESRFHAIRWRDLDLPGVEHEWLIKGVLTRHERSMLAGPSQSGKSFLALAMALAVSRGEDFFGRRVRKGLVLYQAGEGRLGIKKRLRAYRAFHGIPAADDLPFVLLPAAINLYASDDATNALIAEGAHWAGQYPVPLELIIIDTFSAATPGANENASEDVSRVLARCDRIVEETGAAVMLVHHMNAAGGKPRGHTSIVANLENVIECFKLDEHHDADKRAIREAVVFKQKDDEDGWKFRFVLPAIPVGIDKDGDTITSCVVVPPNEGVADEEAGPEDSGIRLAHGAEILLRAIHMAIDAEGVLAPPEVAVAPNVRVVRWTSVRAVYDRLTFEGEGETDEKKRAERVKKALQRNGELLLSRKVIGRQTPWVWLTGRRVRGFRSPKIVAIADRAPAPEDDVLPFLGGPEGRPW